MARFYKTAKPTFVDDAMYEAPYELMLNALKTQDKLYDDTLEPSVDYSDLANSSEYVDKDKEDRDRLLKEQSDVIEGIAGKIQQNPALASVYKADLAKARKDYETLITSGGIHEMDRAAKNRAKAIESTNKKFQLNQIDAKQHAQELEKLERDYTGWAQGGKFADSITSERFVDTEKMAQNLSSIIKAESVGGSSTTVGGDGYFYVKGSTNSYIKKDRLEKIIDTDPEFKQWAKAEEEKYLRDAEAGVYGSEEEALEEFEKSKADHRFNLIDKLVQNNRTSSSSVSSDSSFFALKKLEEERNNYDFKMDIEYEDIDVATASEIFGGGSLPSGPFASGYVTSEQANKVKKDLLIAENKELVKSLSKIDVSPDSFMELMKTKEGRDQLQKNTGMPVTSLARQANLFNTKKQTYKSVGHDFEGTPEEKDRYVKNILGAVHQTKDATGVIYTTSINGVITESGKDNLGSLGSNGKGLISGPKSTIETQELVPLEDGFANKKGEVLKVKDPNDPDKEITATRAQALASSEAKLQKGSKVVEDRTRNPLSGKQSYEMAEVEMTDYKDGFADPVTTVYVSIDFREDIVDKQGRLKTQVTNIKIPKSKMEEGINIETVK